MDYHMPTKAMRCLRDIVARRVARGDQEEEGTRQTSLLSHRGNGRARASAVQPLCSARALLRTPKRRSLLSVSLSQTPSPWLEKLSVENYSLSLFFNLFLLFIFFYLLPYFGKPRTCLLFPRVITYSDARMCFPTWGFRAVPWFWPGVSSWKW